MAEVTELIDRVGKEGDTLGGVVETRVDGLPIGLGTHAQWDRKLDGILAGLQQLADLAAKRRWRHGRPDFTPL